jgi:hypothetical protein
MRVAVSQCCSLSIIARSTLPEDWAAELYNATLSFIARSDDARIICAVASRSYVPARQQRCLNRSALGAS